jgi:DNA (cytosine-5)-methyltransferase 1
MRFVDLFAGIGGFHHALQSQGHECVFASEIDPKLQALYKQNFPGSEAYLHGDIRKAKDDVPAHDVLCGGFPCPSFSKSGAQHGRRENRGKLVYEILHIAKKRRPAFVLLENVGNFERISKGRAWHDVKQRLIALGYHVRATEHLASGGKGLISPHHLGFPHQRERFYVVASLEPLADNPFPAMDKTCKTSLNDIVQKPSELAPADVKETALTAQQVRCINHWNKLLKAIPEEETLPSFPIWGDECWEKYPYDGATPWGCTPAELREWMGERRVPKGARKVGILESLPSYARTPQDAFPGWKVDFIRKNREWFHAVRQWFPEGWESKLKEFPPSLRKMEWNCQGEERDLWKQVLQFRPSGLRAKRYNASPALIAMTATQIPILGPEQRFLTRVEGLRLQGFPDDHALPESRADAFKALGNAVHVGVVAAVAKRALAPVHGHVASEVQAARSADWLTAGATAQ